VDLPTFHLLLTPLGQQAIAHAAELDPTEESFLAALAKLRKQYSADLAKAALETVILRRKAHAKFTRADAMYFTRDGLEVASSEIISRYRAARFTPFKRVADLCCGIGGDTIGLAVSSPSPDGVAPSGEGDRGWGLTALDLSPLHLALAAANLAAYGLRADLIEGDLTHTVLPPVEAAFFDPGRRASGRRLYSVRDYHPPLSIIDSWLPLPLGVKISPGVNLREIDRYDCEVEFISLDGELKECALWFGSLKTTTRRATLLSARSSPIFLTSSDSPRHPVHLSPPLAFLYEPDPAILRAGLVSTLAAQLNAAQLDPDIAYLTSDALTATPFARAFAIEAAMPFSQKRLREKLRAMNVGRVTVKKRGSPLDPDDFARSLKLKGDEERIVFLTHVNGKPWALIGSRIP
jgi:SAM-dependent methyltransferase